MYNIDCEKPLLNDKNVDYKIATHESQDTIYYLNQKKQIPEIDLILSESEPSPIRPEIDIEFSHSINNESNTLTNIIQSIATSERSIENFDEPFYKKKCKFLCEILSSFIKDSLFLILSVQLNMVTILMIYGYMHQSDDLYLLASFGLGISYFQYTFQCINDSIFEVSGLQICKAFAQKNYK